MEKTRRNFLRESLLGVGALLVSPPMIANVLNANERN
ncbi:MAG: twin-arginine translocation signal domain-containing protein, partial [Bacteroidaceae bacterium]|nr:twin-arginine translocation signal domain-containing protein [Bacteroidaceae bacterium]